MYPVLYYREKYRFLYNCASEDEIQDVSVCILLIRYIIVKIFINKFRGKGLYKIAVIKFKHTADLSSNGVQCTRICWLPNEYSGDSYRRAAVTNFLITV